MTVSKPCITIGLDLGTGSAKAVALDRGGGVIAGARSPIITHHDGVNAEQSPEQVWQAAEAVLAELSATLAQTGTPPNMIVLSGAMHSLLVVDDQGQPLAPATTWADQRTCPDLSGQLGEEQTQALYQRTGCPVVGLYHPARLRWRQEHDPDGLKAAKCLVSLTDYVAWRLTGQWAISRSLASATGLVNLHTGRWDELALQISGISGMILPQVLQPTNPIGTVIDPVADELALPHGLAVLAGLSDGAAANLGADGLTGRCVMTLGTSGAVRRAEAEVRLDEHARTWCYGIDGQRWLVGQAMSNGGAVLDWLGKRLYSNLPADQVHRHMLKDAAASPAGSGGLIVSPFVLPERGTPWPTGLSSDLPALAEKLTAQPSGSSHSSVTTEQREHLVRGAMEAVAAAMAVMRRSVWRRGTQAIRLTGQAAGSPLWAQLIADMAGRPVEALEQADGSALGAALLGQVALDDTFDLPACVESIWSNSRPHHPDPRITALYQDHRERLTEILKTGQPG